MKQLYVWMFVLISLACPALGQTVLSRPLADERRIELDGVATLVALSRDGEVLASVIEGRQVVVHSVTSGRQLARFPDQKAPIYAISISPSGELVAIGGAERVVELRFPEPDHEFQFKPRDGKPPLGGGKGTKLDAKVFGYQLPPRLPTLSRQFSHYRGGCVTVWDVKTGESRTDLRVYPDPIIALSFHEDETGLATLDKKFDYAFLALDASKQATVATNKRVRANSFPSPQTTFSSDGVRLASIDSNMNVELFDSRTRQLQVIPSQGDAIPWSVAISPDGRSFVSAGIGGTISLWDFEKAEVLRILDQFTKKNILYIAFTHNDKFIVSCVEDGQLCLHDVKQGRLLLTSQVAKRDIRAVAFGKQFLTVVSGGFRTDPQIARPLLIQHIDLNNAVRKP